VGITKELPTVIAFCAGYGGIERGLDLAGFEHRIIAYVEIEAFAIANLVNKMEAGKLPPAPIYTDLKTFPAELFRDRVDLITGGYPCQPFSSAGQRKGTDDPRHLWPFIRRHIETIKPARCFFENVEGHISLGLSTVISDLEEDGYRATWGIFSAAEVGAPHQRKRVYILGNSKHYGSSSSAIRKSFDETSHNNTQGQEPSGKFTGTSQPDCGRDLPANSYLADSDSSRREQSNQENAGESSKQFNSSGLSRRVISHTDDQRLERRLQRIELDQIRRQKQEVRCPSKCSNRGSWNGHSAWPPEPELGRVVNGCTDRVDRIRMLGNGVVPQTAAKAWEILNGRKI